MAFDWHTPLDPPSEPSQAPQIALFGTSADPPHAGHRGILVWLGQHFDHVAAWASDNPFKRDQSPLVNRMAMLQLLVETLPSPRNVQVYPELSHRYTMVTVEQAQQRWPQAEFTLVIGADLVAQLPKWYRARELFAQVKIVVFPRPGYTLSESDLAPLRQHGASVAIAKPTQQYDISSSASRQDEELPEIPPAIQTYIHENHLYPCQQSPCQQNCLEKLPSH
jgi:nicotinate-nucleotide adenylyltransferase